MATADVAENLETGVVLGAILAGGCEIAVIIINSAIKRKMMKIVENLIMQ